MQQYSKLTHQRSMSWQNANEVKRQLQPSAKCCFFIHSLLNVCISQNKDWVKINFLILLSPAALSKYDLNNSVTCKKCWVSFKSAKILFKLLNWYSTVAKSKVTSTPAQRHLSLSFKKVIKGKKCTFIFGVIHKNNKIHFPHTAILAF